MWCQDKTESLINLKKMDIIKNYIIKYFTCQLHVAYQPTDYYFTYWYAYSITIQELTKHQTLVFQDTTGEYCPLIPLPDVSIFWVLLFSVSKFSSACPWKQLLFSYWQTVGFSMPLYGTQYLHYPRNQAKSLIIYIIISNSHPSKIC